MTLESVGSPSESRPELPGRGQVLGGRFEVESLARTDAIGAVLRATDRKSGKTVAIRLLSRELGRAPGLLDALREECKVAASLVHRNICATYGVGVDPAGSFFVAGEWVDGLPLAQIVTDRRAEGRQMSLRGAYNVIAHLCRALSHAHGTMPHGALRPGVVWVSRAGRVKLADFGVARAVIRHAGAAALGPDEQPSLAPEVKSGAEPDAAADVFGLGAVLYGMLTGRTAAEAFAAPSSVHPDGTRELDAVLLRALGTRPADRYRTPEEMRQALHAIAIEAPEVPGVEDFGTDIDLDIDLASAPPPRPRSRPPVTAPAAAPAADGRPRVGSRISIDQEFRPSLAGQTREAPAAPGRHDLGDVLAKITENDAPRWMVVKDGFDHGPFSGRELVELILKSEVLGDHGLVNIDTGERLSVGDYGDFKQFLEQAGLRRKEELQRKSLAKAEKVESASNLVKFIVAGGVLTAIALGVGVYIVSRQKSRGAEEHAANLAALYERGEISIEGTAGILPDAPARTRRSGGGNGGRGAARAGAGGGLSYEDAMNQPMELGDVTSGGSERRLSSGDVAGVMNRHISQLFGCVSQELRAGGALGRVQIDLAIAGSGQVLGASVSQGSPGFQSCIAQRVRSVRFPAFPAPRMGARYSFAVD